jgi:hypothetical protein
MFINPMFLDEVTLKRNPLVKKKKIFINESMQRSFLRDGTVINLISNKSLVQFNLKGHISNFKA